METSPLYISIGFGLTALITTWIFWKAAHQSLKAAMIFSAWIAVQSIIGLAGFYTKTDILPPRFALVILPPILMTIYLFATTKGRAFLDTLDLKTLTWLHTVRVPVELILLSLFLQGGIPQILTFEGQNFDIISGITAPIVAWLGFEKQVLSKPIILVWNFICLALLLNVVFHGVLSVPTPFQKFGFEQPNTAMLHFPYLFLPGLVVPLVLLSHLAVIRRLLLNKKE
jgi:hypothetical protein